MSSTKKQSTEIRIDAELCQAHGQCELVAPAFFELRDDGLAHVSKDEVTEEDLPVLDEAVVRCPTGAITVVRR